MELGERKSVVLTRTVVLRRESVHLSIGMTWLSRSRWGRPENVDCPYFLFQICTCPLLPYVNGWFHVVVLRPLLTRLYALSFDSNKADDVQHCTPTNAYGKGDLNLDPQETVIGCEAGQL